MVKKPRVKKETNSMSTDIEKKSLEAHVELCAERYATLSGRYNALQIKLDNLSSEIKTIQDHILFVREALAGSGSKFNKQIITIGTSLFGVLAGSIITLIIALINKS